MAAPAPPAPPIGGSDEGVGPGGTAPVQAPADSDPDADRVRPPKSIFTGLTWDKGTCSWRVRVNVRRRQHHVGRFDDEREAALAYDCAALLLLGPRAALNFGAAVAEAALPSYAGRIHLQALRRLQAELAATAAGGGGESGPATGVAVRGTSQRHATLRPPGRKRRRLAETSLIAALPYAEALQQASAAACAPLPSCPFSQLPGYCASAAAALAGCGQAGEAQMVGAHNPCTPPSLVLFGSGDDAGSDDDAGSGDDASDAGVTGASYHSPLWGAGGPSLQRPGPPGQLHPMLAALPQAAAWLQPWPPSASTQDHWAWRASAASSQIGAVSYCSVDDLDDQIDRMAAALDAGGHFRASGGCGGDDDVRSTAACGSEGGRGGGAAVAAWPLLRPAPLTRESSLSSSASEFAALYQAWAADLGE